MDELWFKSFNIKTYKDLTIKRLGMVFL